MKPTGTWTWIDTLTAAGMLLAWLLFVLLLAMWYETMNGDIHLPMGGM